MGKLDFAQNSETHSGLSDEEVLINRAASGRNILTQQKRKSWMVVKDVITDPMFILLLIACSIYFITGKPHEGIMMVVAIIRSKSVV